MTRWHRFAWLALLVATPLFAEEVPLAESLTPTLAFEMLDPPAPKSPPAQVVPEKTFEVGQNLKAEASWRNGLWFESPDKAFRFNVGGVVQFDMGWYEARRDVVRSIGTFNNLVDPGLALQDGMDLRRARIRFAGSMWEQVEFFAQYDFAQSLDLRRRTLGVTQTGTINTDLEPAESVIFNEIYIGLIRVPLFGNVRVGRHRESLNFVTATADNNQLWLERGLVFEAFNGDFNFSNGVTLQNTYLDDRVYSLIGFFQNSTRNFSAVGDGEYAYDGRLTALPISDEASRQWLHVGFDYSYRNLHMDQVRYRARPEVRTGNGFQVPNIISTGTIFSHDAQQIANVELASAWGRLTLTTEATASWVTNAYTGALPATNGKLPKGAVSRGTFFAQGAYVEALWFLTPDHHGYRKDRPGYDRVIPSSTFYLLNGEQEVIHSRGAWEVGVRFDYLDLNDAGVNGGVSNAITLCLNWYLNPNARVQTNYFWMNRDFSVPDAAGRVNGDLQGLGIRFNCDF